MKAWKMAAAFVLLANMAGAGASEGAGGHPASVSFSDAGIRYIQGGIGIEEHEHLRALEQDYNVRLEFADPTGAYHADVGLLIEDINRHDTVVEVADGGPIVLASLPAGTYRLTAVANGKTRTQIVKVSGARRIARVIYL